MLDALVYRCRQHSIIQYAVSVERVKMSYMNQADVGSWLAARSCILTVSCVLWYWDLN